MNGRQIIAPVSISIGTGRRPGRTIAYSPGSNSFGLLRVVPRYPFDWRICSFSTRSAYEPCSLRIRRSLRGLELDTPVGLVCLSFICVLSRRSRWQRLLADYKRLLEAGPFSLHPDRAESKSGGICCSVLCGTAESI